MVLVIVLVLGCGCGLLVVVVGCGGGGCGCGGGVSGVLVCGGVGNLISRHLFLKENVRHEAPFCRQTPSPALCDTTRSSWKLRSQLLLLLLLLLLQVKRL